MNLRYFIELLILASLWGASFLFMRLAVDELGPIWLIEFRIVFAVLCLLPIVLHLKLLTSLKQQAKTLLIVGTLNSALPFSLFAYATLTLTGGFTAILNATTPLFGVLLVIFGRRENLSKAQIGGFLLGFAGVALLLGWQPVAVKAGFWLAVTAGLLGALMYALSAHYIKAKLSGVPAPAIATGSMIGAALTLLPLLPFTAPEHLPSLTAILATIALGVLSTAMAYLIYFRLVRLIGPTRTLTVTYMIPMFAIFWGALLLHEPITPDMIIGCGIILAGTAMANGLFSRWKK